MSLNNYPLLTFHDAVNHTLDEVLGGQWSPRNLRQAIRAVQEAYAEVPMRRMWRYYYRPITFQTVASQTTGSIAYDYTGGSSERMVTLTGTTWPTDVTKYSLYVSGVRYSIASYVSSTVITLDEKDCPTADLDAGTGYTLTRDTYELPDNVREVLSLYDTAAPGHPFPCVDPGDIVHHQRIMRNTALPRMYGVYRSERYASGLAIHFAPSPSSSRKYQCLALCWPQPIKTFEYITGSVATTANSATVTGTGTTFSTEHVGAVIRFSSNGSLKLPTDIQGEIDQNRMEPYAMQRVVSAYTSSTSIEMEQTADLTLSGSGYRISSRIDIEPGAMRQAFLRCCEARFATQDRKGAQEREARYEKALMLAMTADQRLAETQPASWMPNSLAGVASSVDLTTGGVQP